MSGIIPLGHKRNKYQLSETFQLNFYLSLDIYFSHSLVHDMKKAY